MSEDPMGMAAGDTNLFRYCAGDPVNRTDPSGLASPQPDPPKKNTNEVAQHAAAFANTMTSLGGGDWRSGSFMFTDGEKQAARDAVASSGTLTLGFIGITASDAGRNPDGTAILRALPANSTAAMPRFMGDRIVVASLNQAWKDSNPYGPTSRKVEQGGWIVRNEKAFWQFLIPNYSIIRVPSGTIDRLATILGTRPDGNVVGWFHTHPVTREDGYAPDRPSGGDIGFTQTEAKVPGIIKTHYGDVFIPYP